VSISPHDALSKMGALWALGLGCVVVVTETELSGCGIADAVGFGITKGRKRGVLIESKVSRSDFLRDKKKWHRRMDTDGTMGISDRYYIAPEGMLHPDEMPTPWGLLVVAPGDEKPRIVKRATYTKPDDSWWAHHFATVAKMLCNRVWRECEGATGFIPDVRIPGLPDDLARSLAPLSHTHTHSNGHGEVYPELQLDFGESA
jgi:hypothetical protein